MSKQSRPFQRPQVSTAWMKRAQTARPGGRLGESAVRVHLSIASMRGECALHIRAVRPESSSTPLFGKVGLLALS